jgi:hypothetical protein
LPKEEKVVVRAYISLKYPFLAIHAKGGESISPKQKGRTTTNFQNLKGLEMMIFSIGILFLIEFQNWFTLFKKLTSKTLLNSKRRILLRGGFV